MGLMVPPECIFLNSRVTWPCATHADGGMVSPVVYRCVSQQSHGASASLVFLLLVARAPPVCRLGVQPFKPDAVATLSPCDVFSAVSWSLEQPDVCLFCRCTNSFFGLPVLFQVALDVLAV